MIWQLLFVFSATVVIDALWTSCVLSIGRGSALKAAALSSAIILLNGLVVVEYVANRRAIGAAALGGAVGTFLAVRRAG